MNVFAAVDPVEARYHMTAFAKVVGRKTWSVAVDLVVVVDIAATEADLAEIGRPVG
jgi:hypothetical protein